jgi:acetamidase/formamidase
MAEHYLDDSAPQPFWDNSVTPRLTIAPGDTVVVDCAEPIGQVEPTWTNTDFAEADPALAHALTGSIAVEGAEPGDVLAVEVLDIQHKGWGWSGHIPQFGLLPDEFEFPFLRHWELDGNECRYPVGDIVIPAAPFPGVVGVAPAEAGRIDTIPPRANAGNIDTKDLVAGSTAFLPVFVPGALFSVGDCHAAQGDGEVCGTGIESPMTVTIRFDVRRDMTVNEVQIRRAAPRDVIDGEVHIMTAHGPDLYENARRVTRYMIEWLMAEFGLERSDAYIICSIAGDLHISEVVDAPNWIVSLHMPLAVFGG